MHSDPSFSIDATDLHWLPNQDERLDLCAHGKVFLTVKGVRVLTGEEGAWTLSVACVHLMRTVFEDYKAGNYSAQLLPCCGHAVFIDASSGRAMALGCPRGIDWQVTHAFPDVKIQFYGVSPGASSLAELCFSVKLKEYAESIAMLSDKVEAFYDPAERDGYLALRAEWKALRSKVQARIMLLDLGLKEASKCGSTMV